MARATMADLIGQLRARCNTGTASMVIGTTSYFSDDHLQEALDNHATIVDFEPLSSFGQRSGAAYVYRIYDSNIPFWEGTPTVTDSLGTPIAGTSFAFNYQTGRVTFNADQGGSVRTVSGTAYNVNLAAADVWRAKASYYAEAYDISTDNHNLSRSQLVKQANERASYYAALGRGGGAIDLIRGDM